MKNFTLLWMVVFLAFGLTVQAQRSYNLTIDAPSPVAGTYFAIPAQFGSQDFCADGPFSAEWMIIEDTDGGTLGCTPVVNDLTGKIALIDRGTCNFSLKCYNAQAAGAIAAIVCNNADTAPFSMAAGDSATAVVIPCFMMSKADCDLIRVETPAEMTLEPNIPVDNSTDIVVWGNNPGEGDFDGGLNGWTSNNISCAGGAPATTDLWIWTPEGSSAEGVGGGPGAYGNSFIGSFTSCNGAVSFNSDFYDNNGVQGDFGLGPCPASQEGELISPPIDISGVTAAGLTLRFNQVTRQFQSEYYVGWSTDDGATWTEVQINTDLVTNDNPTDNTLRVPMPGAAGNSTLRVKFRYVANYYYWVIDDVKIIEQEAYNMQISNEFYAIPQNYQWPYGQLDPIAFLADVGNVGASSQDNVNLNMTITEDAGGSVVYTDDKDYGTIPGNTVIENDPFAFQWVPTATATAGSYTGAYTVTSSEADFDDSDNSRTFNFIITEDVFAKENGFTRDVFPAASNYGEPDIEFFSWAYGNHYYVENADEMILESCSFIVANGDDPDMLGKPVLAKLYKWEDENEDGNADPGERGTAVALGFYVIDGTETTDQLIEVPLLTALQEEYALEDNTDYLLMIEYVTEDVVDLGITLSLGANDDVDYSAMVLATGDYFSPRYSGMLGVASNIETEPYSSVGFGRDLVPVVRMNVKFPNSANEVISNEVDLMEITPVPAQESINVQFKLDEPAVDATLEIVDLSGRSLLINQYELLQKQQVSINVSNLKNGIYLAILRTANGLQTERFVIQK